MDSQGMHVRDTIVVDQAFLDGLPLQGHPAVPPPRRAFGSTIVLAGRRVEIRGGVLTGFALVVVADELSGPGVLEVRREQAADPLRAGGPGYPVTVFARTVSGGGVRSVGQTGGKGAPGDDTTEPPAPVPPPPGPVQKPDQAEPGLPGGPGRQGLPGGPGGDVRVVTTAPPGAGTFEGSPGQGGESGDGGRGGPAGSGRGPHPRGPQGPRGARGTAGARRDPRVEVVPAGSWTSQVAGQPVAFRLAELRQLRAEMLFRAGQPAAARAELAVSGGLAAIPANRNPLPPSLPALLETGRDSTGVERDQDLGEVADRSSDALRRVYEDTVKQLTNDLGDPAVLQRVRAVAPPDAAAFTGLLGRLRALLLPGGGLTERENAAQTRSGLAAGVATRVAGLGVSADGRLDDALLDLGAGTVLTAPGAAPLPASLLVAAIRQLAAQGGRGLAPVAPNLLLLPGTRAAWADLRPGDPVLAARQQAAAGLGDVASWPVRDVDLLRVADDLRARTGPPALLDLLVERVQLLHQARLAALRTEQAAATRTTLEHHRTVAQRMLDALSQPRSTDPFFRKVELALVRETLLVLADDLEVDARRAERLVELTTFGLGSATPPTGSQPVAYRRSGDEGSSQALADPSVAFDLQEVDPSPTLAAVEAAWAQRLGRDLDAPLDAYWGRGLDVRDSAAFAARRTFSPDQAPHAFARFGSARSLWFDLRPTDLAGPQATPPGPHHEAKVVGVRVWLTFGGSAGPGSFTVSVLHLGTSVQRSLPPARLDLAQVQLAARADLTVRPVQEGSSVYVGSVPEEGLDPAPPFSMRGAAGGWLLGAAADADLSTLTEVEVEVLYHCLLPAGTASLRRVSMTGEPPRAGATGTANLRLTTEAPAGGLVVRLASSDPATVAVPPTVPVPAGTKRVDFSYTAVAETGPLPCVVSASSPDGVTRRARVSVGPAPVETDLGTSEPVVAVLALPPAPAAGPGPRTPLPGGARPAVRALAVTGSATGPGSLADLTGAPGQPQRRAALPAGIVSAAADPSRSRVYLLHASADGAGRTVAAFDTERLTLADDHVLPGPARQLAVDRASGAVVAIRPDQSAVEVFDSRLRLAATLTDGAGRLSGMVAVATGPRLPEQLPGVPTGPITQLAGPTTAGAARAGAPAGDPSGVKAPPVEPGPGPRPVPQPVVIDRATVYLARKTPKGVAVTGLAAGPEGFRVERSSAEDGTALDPLTLAVGPRHVVVACAATRALPRLVVLDRLHLVRAGEVILPAAPLGMALSPDGTAAFVASGQGLHVVDLRPGRRRVAGTVPLGAGGPVSVDPATGTVLVGDRGRGRLLRLDRALANLEPTLWT